MYLFKQTDEFNLVFHVNFFSIPCCLTIFSNCVFFAIVFTTLSNKYLFSMPIRLNILKIICTYHNFSSLSCSFLYLLKHIQFYLNGRRFKLIRKLFSFHFVQFSLSILDFSSCFRIEIWIVWHFCINRHFVQQYAANIFELCQRFDQCVHVFYILNNEVSKIGYLNK